MAGRGILITGGGGQLAQDLARLLPESTALTRQELSITDRKSVEEEIGRREPAVVLNCAAYNAVDRAEREPELAMAVNADGAGNLASACRRSGAKLVHFSTNYVFDGKADRPYREGDKPKPMGAYARSKREGELRVLAETPGALVIRSAGLFGHAGSAIKGGSFPDRLLARAKAGDDLAVVADQLLNPTYTGHLAEATVALVEEGGLTGIVHLVAAGCCSYHDFAVEILRLAGIETTVKRISTSEAGAEAPRPHNGCLESGRVAPLPNWRDGLRDYWLAGAGAKSS
jgi:dTDP-4-dehydrorhamnose reductase